MKASFPNSAVLFRWFTGLTGVLLLIASSLAFRSQRLEWMPILLVALFVAFQIFFSIEIFQSGFILSNGIILGSGLLFGPNVAGWGGLFGVGLGFALRTFLPAYRMPGWPAGPTDRAQVPFIAGLHLLPVLIVLSLTGLPGFPPGSSLPWPSLIAASLFFPALHGALFLADVWLRGGLDIRNWRKELSSLAWSELLPVPFILLVVTVAASASPGVKTAVLLLLGGVPAFATILLGQINSTRSQLERRLEELSTLNRISRSVRASLDLENLLDVIHLQVTRLLDVDNFYVALYDPSDQQIWYPLAVKHGQRRQWPRRPLIDRLTDRVIREGKPILLPHHAQEELARIGSSMSEESPYAWIGVPLIASEQTIGCLALFSLSRDVEFTEEDLNLLTTLSGQTSVAIQFALQNALLLEDVAGGSEQIASVFDSFGEGFVLVEASGRITQVNETIEKVTGLKQKEYLGKQLFELSERGLQSLGLTRLEAEELVLNLAQGQFSPPPRSSRTVEGAGEDRTFERVIAVARGSGGSTIGFVIILRDITVEEQSTQARELVTETLVHDLRSPIGSVLGALDVMEEAIQAGEPAEISFASISIARRSAQKMLRMVESLLEVARLQSGKLDLTFTSVGLGSLVAQTLSEFHDQSQGYQVQLVNAVPRELPEVPLDRDKITRVLTNLVDNALKFTPSGGTVRISAELTDADWMLVQVSDTGPGIPEEYREKVFERFGQVPGQVGRKRGSGLGLTFCRLAIQAHGGQIWVESGPEGGSVFSFTLPCNQPDLESQTT
jgi:PAS domain S-box-containing protein